jgi:hypothetical protein
VLVERRERRHQRGPLLLQRGCHHSRSAALADTTVLVATQTFVTIS